VPQGRLGVIGALAPVPVGPVTLGPVRWLLGCVALGVVLGALGWAAVGVRRALVPAWRGVPARLAEVVAALALLALGAHAAAGPGWFRPLVVLAVVLAVAAAAGVAARWAGARRDAGAPPGPEPFDEGWGGRGERIAAAVAVGLVGLGWCTHAADTYGRGMTEGDTLWYHATFALRFVQLERLWVFPGIATPVQDPFPANAQVLHALAFLPFGRDVLSPSVNLGFGGLALLAAVALGRTRGVGAAAALGAAMVMGLPTVAGTQPGQATNDVVCGALLLAAVALLVQQDLAPGPAVLSGAAAGLAISSKLTVALPVVVLGAGVVVLSAAARRVAPAVAWLAAAAPFPAFWLARNWALAGNPLPWYELRLGPWQLRRTVVMQAAESIADFFGRFSEARPIWSSGLHHAFGRLWPLVLVLALAGGGVAFLPGRRARERLAGVAALAAVVGYVRTPYTMMFAGGLFQDTIRYSFAVVLLGVTLAPLTAAALGGWARRGFVVVALGVVAVNLAAPRTERLAPFVAAAVPGVLAALAVAGAAAAVGVVLWRRGPAALRAAVAVGAAAALAGAGFALQRSYLPQRYVDAGLPLDPVNAWAAPRRHARLAVLGSLHFSPLLGAAAANDVRYLAGPDRGRNTCAGWRAAVAAARPGYLVVGEGGAFFFNPRRSWFDDDPALQRVAGGPGGVLYRVTGPLEVPCRSTAATSR
jgi:hypothetical protein